MSAYHRCQASYRKEEFTYGPRVLTFFCYRPGCQIRITFQRKLGRVLRNTNGVGPFSLPLLGLSSVESCFLADVLPLGNRALSSFRAFSALV